MSWHLLLDRYYYPYTISYHMLVFAAVSEFLALMTSNKEVTNANTTPVNLWCQDNLMLSVSRLVQQSSTVLPRLSVPQLSETSIIRTQFRTWSLFKKNGILTKIADSATEQSTCVCVSYVRVQCRHTVVRHRVQCEV